MLQHVMCYMLHLICYMLHLTTHVTCYMLTCSHLTCRVEQAHPDVAARVRVQLRQTAVAMLERAERFKARAEAIAPPPAALPGAAALVCHGLRLRDGDRCTCPVLGAGAGGAGAGGGHSEQPLFCGSH